jgi:hypothetical protein
VSRFDYDWYMNHANGEYAKREYAHRLDEYGIWEIRGEDPNPDLFGSHNEPIIGHMEGKLDDVIHWAVLQNAFWQWGAGGKFTKINVAKLSEERDKVQCDYKCGAFSIPESFEEYKLAYDHWRNHGVLAGCSHGC